MMTNPQLLFFIGKGGVGKSTASALFSVHLAHTSRETLLVSMDPAHNQRDIFEQDFSEQPKRIDNHLMIKEVDTDFWIEKYLKEAQKQITKTYRYESAFSLQNYFNVLQFSPGLEEYALLLAFENIIYNFQEKDFIVFDMAPTALSLRFFSLPFITLTWLEELLKLRTQIFKKKEIISKIKTGKIEKEQDNVKRKLGSLIQDYEHLGKYFLSNKSRINLVLNQDRLSLSEAFRIREKLAGVGIGIHQVVVNKWNRCEDTSEIDRGFENQKILRIPLVSGGLIGYSILKENRALIGKIFTD
ncbi:MAG: ArsA family ATPase [Thermodesulfobacteriota bacterium]